MSAAPFFSVIIPTYNRFEWVRAALESVLAQEFSDYEIVVIDDGSTDGTFERLQGYGARIKLLRQANAGPAAARNRGLSEARGQYVAFLDSDDLWFPWSLRLYHELLQKHDWPSGLQGCDIHFQSDAEVAKVLPLPGVTLAFTDYLASCGQIRFFGASWWVVKTELLRLAGGFDTSFINCEDLDLRLRIGTAAGFLVVQQPFTFAYRVHDSNMVKAADQTGKGLDILLARERSSAYPGGRERAKERWQLLSRLLRANYFQLLRAGRLSVAWSLYRRSFGWHMRLGRWRFLAAAPVSLLYYRLFGRSGR